MSNFIEHGIAFNGVKIFAKVDDDGLIRYTCFEEDPEYQLWLTKQTD